MVLGSSPVAVTSPSDFAPASRKEFLDIQTTIECGFTLKHSQLKTIEDQGEKQIDAIMIQKKV